MNRLSTVTEQLRRDGEELQKSFRRWAANHDHVLRGGSDSGQHSGVGDPGITEDIIRLLARLEQQPDSDVIDVTTRHSHGDRKALAKEQEKKIAMGHKADDHEEGQKLN